MKKIPASIISVCVNHPDINISELLKHYTLRSVEVQDCQYVEGITAGEQTERLSLGQLGLTQLPTSIGKMKNLKELYLWKNNLTTLPDMFAKLSNLQILSLSNNQFTQIPSVLNKLPNLKYVYIKGLSFSDEEKSQFPSISFLQ